MPGLHKVKEGGRESGYVTVPRFVRGGKWIIFKRIKKRMNKKNNVNLTYINALNIEQITQRSGISEEEVVNRILYMLLSETSDIKAGIEIICEKGLQREIRTDLEYRAKDLQNRENYMVLKNMINILDMTARRDNIQNLPAREGA